MVPSTRADVESQRGAFETCPVPRIAGKGGMQPTALDRLSPERL